MGHGRNDDEPPDEGSPADRSEDRSEDRDEAPGHAREPDTDPDRDEQADEHASRGAPPDRSDRIWVHPTELPALMAASSTASPARSHRNRSWVVPVVTGAAGALAAVIALAVAGALDSRAGPVSTTPAQLGAAPGASVNDLAARTGLSIVGVTARDHSGTRQGSGICIRHEGDVLTTAGIVGEAKTVDIRTSDGHKHAARVVGRDPTTDLVLLAMDDDVDVPAAQLSDHLPDAGAAVWVVAATSTQKLSTWTSGGLLASKDTVAAVSGGPMTGKLLETDAAGSSGAAAGGALVGNDGEVVGIVIGRVKNNATTYAMPITGAVTVAEELRVDGVAKHGSAGFIGSDTKAGPSVWKVTPKGPAAAAGIKPGDVVTEVDGRHVASMDVVTALVRAHDPGDTLTLGITRGKHNLDVSVVLAATN